MPRRIPLRIAAAAIVVGLVASPAAQDAIRIEHRGQFELTGAGTPENVSVAASGPEWRSLLVTLEIQSPTHGEGGGHGVTRRCGGTEDADPHFCVPGHSTTLQFLQSSTSQKAIPA